MKHIYLIVGLAFANQATSEYESLPECEEWENDDGYWCEVEPIDALKNSVVSSGSNAVIAETVNQGSVENQKSGKVANAGLKDAGLIGSTSATLLAFVFG